MRITILCILVALCATPGAHAIEFRVLGWRGPLTGLFFDSGGRTVRVEGSEWALSQTYEHHGGPLVLYRKIVRDEQEVRQTVATLNPPEKLEQAILLLAPLTSEQTGYTGMWIDDSATARPVNHLHFLNLSGHAVAMKLGSEEVVLPVKGAHQQPFDTAERSIPLKLAAQTDEGWQIVSTNPQPVRENFRILILLREGRLLSDEMRRLVDLVPLYDYVEPAP